MSKYFFLILLLAACKNNKRYKSPNGYNLENPQKFELKNALKEISGIVIKPGSDSIFAINDEDGKLFKFVFGEANFIEEKFASKGDYEDLAILPNGKIEILESNGSIYELTSDSVNKINGLLPDYEYEGLAFSKNKLYILCKNCNIDNQSKEVTIYSLEPDNNNILNPVQSFKIQLDTEKFKDNKFRPSSLAQNPVTKDWFIISSTNKLLVIFNEQWKFVNAYKLNPILFKQPEGICFKENGDLLISNEGAGGIANILKFDFNTSQKSN